MIRTECSDNFNWDTQLDDLACLAYTSGSMGKPKGVMLPHRSLANFITFRWVAALVSKNIILARSSRVDLIPTSTNSEDFHPIQLGFTTRLS